MYWCTYNSILIISLKKLTHKSEFVPVNSCASTQLFLIIKQNSSRWFTQKYFFFWFSHLLVGLTIFICSVAASQTSSEQCQCVWAWSESQFWMPTSLNRRFHSKWKPGKDRAAPLDISKLLQAWVLWELFN